MAAQHQEYYRKVGIRTQLLDAAGDLKGALYVPFCGDGDLTVDCYLPRETLRPIYAADNDAARVATFTSRVPDAIARVADCDRWPFDDLDTEPLAVADLDAYAYPYHAWRSVRDKLAPRAVVLFTDGQRQTITRNGVWHSPDGERHEAPPSSPETRQAFSLYWAKTVAPWWKEELAGLGYRQVSEQRYLRGIAMLYWGALIERVPVTASQVAPNAPDTAERHNPPKEPEEEPTATTPGHTATPAMSLPRETPARPPGRRLARRRQVPAGTDDDENDGPLELRPYKFDRFKREEYLDLLRQGRRRGAAAREVGVDPRTVRRWAERVPAFAEEISLAEMEANEKVEDALFMAAESGNTVAMIFWLTNRAPGEWADKRAPSKMIVTGEGGGPIPIDIGLEELRAKVFTSLDALERHKDRAIEAASDDVTG